MRRALLVTLSLMRPKIVRGDDGCRVVKRRVIQNVARIHSQIETHALVESEFLRERRVPLEVVRSEEEIASGVSNRARRRRSKLTTRGLVKPEVPAGLQHELTTVSRAAVAVRS